MSLVNKLLQCGFCFEENGEEWHPYPECRYSTVGPHSFVPKGWRFWLCRRCYAPRSLHPRAGWVTARRRYDNEYFSANAPHFREGR